MKRREAIFTLMGVVLAAISLSACGGEKINTGDNTMKEDNSLQEDSAITEIVISGGSEYIYAPQPGKAANSSAAFYVTANGTPLKTTAALPVPSDGETNEPLVYFSIESSSEGASIDDNGVVSVSDTFLYGDINGADIMLKATLYTNGIAGISKSFSVHVRQPEEITGFEVEFPEIMTNKSTAAFTVCNAKNQYGEPYSPEISTRVETSNKLITVSNNEISANVKLIRYLNAAFLVTIDNITVEKRFIICEPGYTPTEAELSALREGPSPITEQPKIYENAKELDNDRYLYTADIEHGSLLSNHQYAANASLSNGVFSMDVSFMAEHHEGALYQVSYKTADGLVESQDVSSENGKITINIADATAVEVVPVFRFIFGKQRKEIPVTDIQVLATVEYDGTNSYGFCDGADNAQGYVHLKTPQSCFVFDVPDGYYNVDLKKGGTGRSLVSINGQALGCNVGIGGKGDRRGTTPYTYYMEDVNVFGGNIRISLGEKDYDLAAVEIRRATTLKERRRHFYLAGDSTASGYYPIETAEPLPGRYQTGWGQVFEQYVTEDTCVTNLGSGGTYAKSWYEIAFGGVLQNAKPGDCFVIMEGINDQSYSNTDEMYDYLAKMVEECRERDIIPVLCTSMQTPKFWRSATGTDLSEFECPEGGGKAAFMETIRKLSKDKGVFLIDVGLETSQMYGTIGRTYVAQNYHLYNSVSGVEEDTLHLSYAGAMNVSRIIATGLYKLQETGATDGCGKSISGFSFRPMEKGEIIYKDRNGNDAVYTYESIAPVYKRYAIRNEE